MGDKKDKEKGDIAISIKYCCALGRCVVAKELRACSACSETNYCCREHQVEHFKEGGHKLICPGSKKKILSFNECMEKASEAFREKQWSVALQHYSAMLELTERSLGILHFQCANVLAVMVTCYKSQGKFEAASQCLNRVIVIREMYNDGSPERNRELYETMGLLGDIYLQMVLDCYCKPYTFFIII